MNLLTHLYLQGIYFCNNWFVISSHVIPFSYHQYHSMIKEICHFRFQFFRIWIFGRRSQCRLLLLQSSSGSYPVPVQRDNLYKTPPLDYFSVNNCLVNMFEHLHRALLIIITSNNRLKNKLDFLCDKLLHLIDFCKERIQIAIYCQWLHILKMSACLSFLTKASVCFCCNKSCVRS